MTRNELRMNRDLLYDKAKGALCGLAIGDSLGDAARKPENQRDYGITTDFQPGASWSTDDTEFAMLVTETIIQYGGEFTAAHVEEMWMRHVAVEDELRRGGASEVEACNNLRSGLHAPQTGMYNSYGASDGAAMRSGPIGILCAGDPERAIRLAGIDASVSHRDEGIYGAQAVACAVAMAMTDADMDEIIDRILTIPPKGSWFHYTLNLALQIVEDAKGDILSAWMPLHSKLFREYRAVVPEAISEAFCCLKLKNDSFRHGMLLAANFGRDADTIGAVVGAVLGAMHGASHIPQYWLEKTRYPSGTCLQFTNGIDIFERSERLAELVERDA